jgi:outer membrane receptor protein involved in Fe transport
MRRYIWVWVVPFAITSVLGAPSAFAQGQEKAESDTPGLTEIIVTAQKRAEDLQDVPVSVQVIGSQQLAQQNLNSLEALGQTVPSVHINATGSGGQIFIRGIGSGTNQTFDQSVGVFIDDIYHGRARMTGATFLDLDHVEILKGPQSTFFGNNAIAGAFNIVTKKAGDRFDGYARALYGQDGQYAAEGAVGVPLGDLFAVRLAGMFNGIGGWQRNPYAGHDEPADDNQAGRITLGFRPSDALDATLKIEGSRNKDRNGSQIGNCPPPAPFVSAGFCLVALRLGIPTSIESDTNTSGPGQGVSLSTFENVLTVNYRLRRHTLTSVTGFYNYHSNQDIDADGTPSTLLNLRIAEQYHQLSQEFRIVSAADQPIEYLAGIYYQTDELRGEPTDLSYYFLTPTIASRPALAGLVPYLPLGAGGTNAQDEHSYAVFGSVSWNVTDRFKLSAGLRGSWVDKTLDFTNFYGTAAQTYGNIVPLPASLQPLAAAVLGTQTSGTASRSDHDWIPSARIQYKLNPSAMLYASYAKGFKAGVPSAGTTNGIAVPPIRPEHVNAYEVGLKSKWLDNRVLLNLDVFRSDYTDQQVQSAIFTPLGVPIFETTNAGASRSQGVEFEGQWAIATDFRLSANVTYLDSYYVRYPNVTLTGVQTFCRSHATVPDCLTRFPGGVPVLQDLSGHSTEFAPRWSGNLSAAYSTNLPREYHFIAELSTYFSTTYNYANNGTDDPLLDQAGYARLDSRLSLEAPDRRWALDVIGKNLTDRIIIAGGTGGTSLPSSLGSLLLRKDQGRNVAVQFRYQW